MLLIIKSKKQAGFAQKTFIKLDRYMQSLSIFFKRKNTFLFTIKVFSTMLTLEFVNLQEQNINIQII
jgi:hypothetical protein